VHLTSLEVQGFRNATRTTLETAAPIVVLFGDNAQGKTNLLEAVSVLATLKSFREPRSSRWVQTDAVSSRIEGRLDGPIGRQVLRWSFDAGARNLAIDDKTVNDVALWFGAVRAIVVAPEHTRLVRGEPVERRQFLDRAVFTARPAFLDVARAYRKVVEQKGALLRSGRATDRELDAWDDELVSLGTQVVGARAALLAELATPFAEVHGRIAGSTDVRVRMCGAGAADDVESDLRRTLVEQRAEERRRGLVLVGPHRDDLAIEIEGRSARRFASQGQARTLVLALKLAELGAARARGMHPLFLVDDLSSELDRGRLARVSEVLLETPGQVWLTATDERTIVAEDSVRYRISAGSATRS
jgi:DNA replication and repair protein RecF